LERLQHEVAYFRSGYIILLWAKLWIPEVSYLLQDLQRDQ